MAQAFRGLFAFTLILCALPHAWAQQKAPPAPAKHAADPDTVTLNFVNADLEAAVHAFGQFGVGERVGDGHRGSGKEE